MKLVYIDVLVPVLHKSASKPSWYVLTSHHGQHYLTISPWVGVMSTASGHGHSQTRNDELRITVSPVTRADGTLVHLVKGIDC